MVAPRVAVSLSPTSAVDGSTSAAARSTGQNRLTLVPPRRSSYGVLTDEAKWAKLSVPVLFNLTVT